MYFSPILGPTAVEQLIDVLFSHEPLLLLRGVDWLDGGFVEFRRVVLPHGVGVDGPEDVRDIGGQGGNCHSFFLLLADLVLFMHAITTIIIILIPTP